IEVFRSLQSKLVRKKMSFLAMNRVFSSGVLIDPLKQVEKIAKSKEELIDTSVFDYIDTKKALVINQQQFKSILNTLYDNAYDAQQSNVSKHCDIILSSYNQFVCLKFKDYGCGIEQKNLEKIFDEHFTTKPYGSGYGLFYIRKLIMSLGGEISVSSKLGFGTSFTIKIPLLPS
ncbi:HAMP domain-containing histidine kinase, partial [bacterium]|nr:HAMP domain-containing histidine kinase [bacterium]